MYSKKSGGRGKRMDHGMAPKQASKADTPTSKVSYGSVRSTKTNDNPSMRPGKTKGGKSA